MNAQAKAAKIGVLAITQKAMREITARRFVVARQLSGLDQRVAAEKLGYRNSSPLSKIESGAAGVPPYIIQRAALLYGVSMDYLTGLSDYPERDSATVEQIAVMRHLRTRLDDVMLEATKRVVNYSGDHAALTAHIGRLRNLAGESWRAFCGLARSRNPETLRAALEKLVEACDEADSYLKRRQAMKAHEYLDDVEKDFPLLRLMEGGQAGMAEALTKASETQMELKV